MARPSINGEDFQNDYVLVHRNNSDKILRARKGSFLLLIRSTKTVPIVT